MLITVTKDHIDQGITSSKTSCPIALALIEKFHSGVYVTDDWSCILYGGKLLQYKNPYSVGTFIGKFDRSENVEPFSFELGDSQ